MLAVTLVQATRGLDVLVRTAWSRRVFGWLPAPPASIAPGTPGGILPPTVWYLAACAWIVSFVALVLGRYRTAQVIAALAIVPDLVWLLQGEFTGALPPTPLGPWAFWVLPNLAPVLAMTAFHPDAVGGAPASAATSALTISAAGRTWVPVGFATRLPGRELEVELPSRNQALQLQRILAASG